MIQTLLSERFRLAATCGLLFVMVPPFFGYWWTRGVLLAERHVRHDEEREEEDS